ncbi:MAG: single-stranded DNA-binding protein [Arcobacter sp.]|nr:single-stranded DNA-binding protein [Arcobacter sp.]|tara:strand:- start:7534 stop:7965 length:432 start_codon:yes stop_codon:yes gene_type:complete
MYNKVIFVGNLTRDIELKFIKNGTAVAKSAIATTFKYKSSNAEQKEEVCFLDFTIFGRSAEVANQYLHKGSKVLLEGRLIFDQWIAQDGTNRNRHSLRVETMKMLGSKDENRPSAVEHKPEPYQAKASEKIPEVDIDEDDIPF